ncbi:MAG: A/G-specific adenine glycosylase [Bacteroidia bacterium]|nr:A/G-specific adenine glycosylase [Bacteroidia bacterium]
MSLHPYSQILQNWYHIYKRDLPWRDVSDPYLIWISEIILQQTRVAQGMDYYLRFVTRFPNVLSLAKAEEQEVLKYWQGLGYYSRARNLHKAARQIAENYGGQFPHVHTDILKLSGIGIYTAAAIASFAYGQPYAVVDGNVYRVLSRVFGIDSPIDSPRGQKEFAALAAELLDSENAGTHNQAIMEFGALQCVPVNPDCGICPLKDNCVALKTASVDKLPVKERKTKIKARYFNYLFIKHENQTYLQKRESQDIWKNLYEFPLIESDRLFTVDQLIEQDEFKTLFPDTTALKISSIYYDFKHILTHRHIFARFFMIETDKTNSHYKKFGKTLIDNMDHLPISRLTELFLEKIFTR